MHSSPAVRPPGTGARHGSPQGVRVEHSRFDPCGEGGSLDQSRALGSSQVGIDESELRADAVGVNGGDLLLPGADLLPMTSFGSGAPPLKMRSSPIRLDSSSARALTLIHPDHAWVSRVVTFA